MLKKLISGLLILVIAVFFIYQQTQEEAQREAMLEAPAVLVSAVDVQVQAMPVLVNAFGSLRAQDAVCIASEVDGIVAQIDFAPGQRVHEGDLLMQLDAAEQQAALTQAQADLVLSQTEFNRLSNLLERQAVSQQDVDKAKATLDVSQAAVDIAQLALNRTQIKAPFDGVLGTRALSVGDYVSRGESLVEIVSAETLRLEYHVPERYLSQLALGQEVQLITSAYPQETFTGIVDYIAPAIHTSTRTLGVEALIDNSDQRLAAGLSVQLSQVLAVNPDALVIPEESLIPTVEGYAVFIIDDEDFARQLPVLLDTRLDGLVVVTEGLSSDDTVVTRGQEKLRDGALVEIFSDAPELDDSEEQEV